MDTQALRATLELASGGKPVLTTDQLAKVIGMNAKVISRMRSENRFPIPPIEFGGKILYSIDVVIAFMLGQTAPVTKQTAPSKTRIEPQKRRTPPKTSQYPDLSAKMALRGLLTFLQEQSSTIAMVEKMVSSKIAHDELQEELSTKTTTNDVDKI
jgi:hypothetical protein